MFFKDFVFWALNLSMKDSVHGHGQIEIMMSGGKSKNQLSDCGLGRTVVSIKRLRSYPVYPKGSRYRV